jgi:peptide/nickel transport system permease protein
MLRYLGARLLYAIPTVTCVVFAVFLLLHLIPGDPAQVMLGVGASEQDLAALREKLGLDRPLVVQFARYASGVLSGDLGDSFAYRKEVLRVIFERLPATLELTFAAMLLACGIGIPLGVEAAIRRRSSFDLLCRVIALVGVSFPVFWLAIQLMYLFAVTLPLLPLSGRGGPVYTWSGLRHLVLPAVALSTIMLPSTMRLTRSSMLEVLGQEYVRVARSKGLRELVVLYKHAFRNAILPVVTNIGLQFGMLLGGAFLTEHVFAWPGIGQLTIHAIFRRDFPLVQGVILVTALAFFLVNLGVDVSYAYLDPRVRREMAERA